MRKLVFVSVALLVSACSSGKDTPLFRTVGVSPPEQSCPVDPRSFAKAEPVEDMTEGNGCGIRNGFKLYEVDGVKLSQPAIVTCNVANTFHNWLQQTAQPKASQVYGAQISEIKIAASYACRPRNNVRGAKLSEHGMGNAIDVSGFSFDNGRQVTVLGDYYGASSDRNFLSSIRRDACGPFHTVLGPGSDSSHRDHIHLDLQKMRSGGPYCH
jgi:hypothetical protein